MSVGIAVEPKAPQSKNSNCATLESVALIYPEPASTVMFQAVTSFIAIAHILPAEWKVSCMS